MQPDSQLVERAKRGERAACEELVRRHQDRVFHYALYLLPSWQDAEDVTQETFLQACRNLKRFRGDASFATWLLAIARTQVALWYRRRKRQREVIEVIDLTQADPAPPALLQIEIRSAVAALPTGYREAIVLRYVNGLDLVEVAKALGISAGAAGVRLHRARKLLRESLGPVLTEEVRR